MKKRTASSIYPHGSNSWVSLGSGPESRLVLEGGGSRDWTSYGGLLLGVLECAQTPEVTEPFPKTVGNLVAPCWGSAVVTPLPTASEPVGAWQVCVCWWLGTFPRAFGRHFESGDWVGPRWHLCGKDFRGSFMVRRWGISWPFK